MSDTHFILTGLLTIIVFAVTTFALFYFTRSLILAMIIGFVIVEIGFVILAMNREGFFLWAMVIIFIPLFHFCAFATLAHSYDEISPTREWDINKVPKDLRDALK